MRKLILEEWISLDGFAEDRDGKLDFFPSSDENKFSDQDQLKFIDGIDTILLGRKTYELFADFWPTATRDKEIIADKLNGTAKLIVSNTLKKAPWGKWPEAGILAGNIVEQIRTLKNKKGKDIVLWGSISLAQVLMKENLIDQIHLQICPTVVGAGRPLFPDLQGYKNFKLLTTRAYDTGVIFMSFEV